MRPGAVQCQGPTPPWVPRHPGDPRSRHRAGSSLSCVRLPGDSGSHGATRLAISDLQCDTELARFRSLLNVTASFQTTPETDREAGLKL